MFDNNDTPYLDLQMWYASCNLGYKNPKISNAVIDCINSMPQIASRFLFENKVLLASKIARANEKRFNIKGRVHFNVGGAQAVEDALKLVRNYTGKNLLFAFMGGYHGRTIGTSCVTSSYRYREYFGHFGDRAHLYRFLIVSDATMAKNAKIAIFIALSNLKRILKANINLSMTRLQENQNM